VRFPVLRPLLPTADKLLPYLQRIDDARWYTNFGPLLKEFEAGLAQHFALDDDQLVTCTNATLAMTQILRAFDILPDSLCVMPSWTFVATPASAIWGGLQPYFVDVDPVSWLIRPEDVREIAAKQRVGAVIVVSAFGAPLDVAVWEEFNRSTGIPVVIDAAAGFDGFARYGEQQSSVPVVISLHATKVSGIGEGAVVLTQDAALAKRVRQLGNFGFYGNRDAVVMGANTKMSEYVAASGLALLAEWPDRRQGWKELSVAFAAEVDATPELRCAPGFNEGWISSYGLVELPFWISAVTLSARLQACGVETRQWWSSGCHEENAYRHCPHGPLPETERLGDQVIGLPFWLGLTTENITEIFQIIREVIAEEMQQPVLRSKTP
jgi:dTDP-4-amino-4,6-dideoxygalactose transaminase